MSVAPEESDRINFWLLVAILVFAAFGLIQILFAVIYHKIALGADGAHNLLEFFIIGYAKSARRRGTDQKKNWLNCTAVPRSTEFTAYFAIIAAVAFAVFEFGREEQRGAGLALGLVLLSAVINLFFATRLNEHEDHDHNAGAMASHLIGDTFAALSAAAGYVVLLVTGYDQADLIATVVGILVVVIVHIEPIRTGRRQAERHRPPDHTHPLSEPDHVH